MSRRVRSYLHTTLLSPTVLFIVLGLGGCSDDGSSLFDTGGDTGGEGISIAGTYVDDFGSVHRISDDAYILGWAPNEAGVAVTAFDNDAGWLVGQNASDHPFNPDKWTRLEWTVDGDDLYVCQSVFAADAETDAIDAELADPSDPGSGGCGGSFPWSLLTEGQGPLTVIGSYSSDVGFLVIGPDGLHNSWRPTDQTHAIDSFDNEGQYIVAQNGADDAFNPDKWSRFDWTYTDDGSLYWCQSAFGAETAGDAEAVTVSDRSDPANGGCGGSFPWSQLTPDPGAIAAAGAWDDGGDGSVVLSPTGVWTIEGDTFAVDSYDNAAGTAIAQNGSDNADNANLWSRFDWVFVGATLYLCHTASDTADAEAAGAVTAADTSDPPSGGCGGNAFVELTEQGALADTIVGSSASADDLELAINGVRGGGSTAGGADVYSLTYAPGNDSLTLTWSGMRVVNGGGDDFVVFENPFLVSGGPAAFMDPTIIEVSNGGEEWVTFPHDYVAVDETVYSASAFDWWGFAGVTPVLLHEEDNPVSPFDAAAAGGDGFDLDDLAGDGAAAIRESGFTHLRLVAAPTVVNPDTEALFVRDPVATGPDIDGVYARYVEPEATE